MRWAARSVMPTVAATSRSLTFGSSARQSSTWAWLVMNVHGLFVISSLTYD